jgi:excisionase family DNA binding protein
VDVNGAATYLGVSRRSVCRMVDAGALQAVRIPSVRALRFDLRDLERLIELGKASQ